MAQIKELIATPDLAAEGGEVTRVPVDVLNLKWCYTHYPSNWTHEDGEWLPDLTRLSFRNGLNGQTNDNTDVPKAHAAKKGCVIIEPTHPRLGRFRNYRHQIPARDPNSGAMGTYYPSMFETATMVGARTVRWNFDAPAFREFRRLLVEIGLIEPISRVVAEGRIATVRNIIDQLQQIPQHSTSRDERIAKMIASADAMEASLPTIDDQFIDDPVAAPRIEAPKAATRTRKAPATDPA